MSFDIASERPGRDAGKIFAAQFKLLAKAVFNPFDLLMILVLAVLWQIG